MLHKDRYRSAELFAEKLGVDYTDDPGTLNDIARTYLRKRFLTAEMGISGANFAVAEDGAIALVTNEGNGRLCTTVPRIHVAVMGMERLVRDREDLGGDVRGVGTVGDGPRPCRPTPTSSQDPADPGEPDGPDQFHVVIVDNGRSATLGFRGSRDPLLHPLRRLSQRLPRLPACRRARLRLGVPGPDRQGAHPFAVRARGVARSAGDVIAVRSMPGGVPGAHRHPGAAGRDPQGEHTPR